MYLNYIKLLNSSVINISHHFNPLLHKYIKTYLNPYWYFFPKFSNIIDVHVFYVNFLVINLYSVISNSKGFIFYILIYTDHSENQIFNHC